MPPLPLSRRNVLIGGAGLACRLAVALARRRADEIADHRRQCRAAADRDPGFRRRASPADGEVGAGVAQVITNNLKRSGLFAPIDPAAFIEKIVNIDTAPQFQNWKTINAQALVTGRMTRQGDGRLKAEFRLWDVAAGQQLDRPAIFHLAGILAADRAHHLRPDL